MAVTYATENVVSEDVEEPREIVSLDNIYGLLDGWLDDLPLIAYCSCSITTCCCGKQQNDQQIKG